MNQLIFFKRHYFFTSFAKVTIYTLCLSIIDIDFRDDFQCEGEIQKLGIALLKNNKTRIFQNADLNRIQLQRKVKQKRKYGLFQSRMKREVKISNFLEGMREMRTVGRRIKNQDKSTKVPIKKQKSTPRNNRLKQKYEDHLKSLEENELLLKTILSKQQFYVRKKLTQWLVHDCLRRLELTCPTIEHTIRLFDLLVEKNGGLSKPIIQTQLDFVTCLFISCKYMEIYPPSVRDLEIMTHCKISCSKILLREVQILLLINFKLVFSISSDWYSVLFKKKMPGWALESLPTLQATTSMKILAQNIYRVEQIQFIVEDESQNEIIQIKVATLFDFMKKP